jgi:hypothetical protein
VPLASILRSSALQRIASAPAATTNTVTVGTFDLEDQFGTFWCWAAVASSVARFYSIGLSQCDLASKRHREQLSEGGHPDPNHFCCNPQGRANEDGLVPRCDHADNLSLILPLAGVPFTTSAAPQSPVDAKAMLSKIKGEIQAHHPICLRITWTDQGYEISNHYIVLYGYQEIGGVADAPVQMLTADPSWAVSISQQSFEDLFADYSPPELLNNPSDPNNAHSVYLYQMQGRVTMVYFTSKPA